jgi:hypothetical protein
MGPGRKGIALGLGALVVSRAAAGAPLTLDLDWRAPSGCPDRNAIRRYVEEMLGSAEPATSSLSARGDVARVAVDRWIADLTLKSSSGAESTRSFEGPTCESVSRAAALVMALTMHPTEAPPAQPANPEKEKRAPERPIAGRFARPEIAVAGALDAGTAPGPTYGLMVAGGWSPFAAIRWEAFGSYFFKRRGTLADQTQLGADVQLAAFGLRGCYPALDAAVSLAPCIGGGFDWLRASGFGAKTPGDGNAFAATVAGGAIILWNFSEFASVRLEGFGVIPLTRPEFVIVGAGSVYRPAPVAFRGAIGMEVHF